MKKIVLILIMLFSSLAMSAQVNQPKIMATQDFVFISTYYIRDKPTATTNIRRNMVISIGEKEIQMQNFAEGTRASRTLFLIIDRIENKDWNLDGNCKTYYCHTQEAEATYGEQKAIVYVTNGASSKVMMGLFNDEISITKYKFCKN
jgi:hypothetical protein